jgi:hypothetical protein
MPTWPPSPDPQRSFVMPRIALGRPDRWGAVQRMSIASLTRLTERTPPFADTWSGTLTTPVGRRPGSGSSACGSCQESPAVTAPNSVSRLPIVIRSPERSDLGSQRTAMLVQAPTSCSPSPCSARGGLVDLPPPVSPTPRPAWRSSLRGEPLQDIVVAVPLQHGAGRNQMPGQWTVVPRLQECALSSRCVRGRARSDPKAQSRTRSPTGKGSAASRTSGSGRRRGSRRRRWRSRLMTFP